MIRTLTLAALLLPTLSFAQDIDDRLDDSADLLEEPLMLEDFELPVDLGNDQVMLTLANGTTTKIGYTNVELIMSYYNDDGELVGEDVFDGQVIDETVPGSNENADTTPVDTSGSEVAKAKSRRVEFVLQ